MVGYEMMESQRDITQKKRWGIKSQSNIHYKSVIQN
jgi:hypothetical protein